jgi:putative Holliday junction resolvase
MTAGPARPGRALGIDLGTRRIGIAVSDSAGTMAMPRATLYRTRDLEGDRRRLVELIVAEEATMVVVGLPLSLDGSHGRAAQSASDEADALRAMLEGHRFDGRQVEVELFDERLTTVSAHQALAAGGTRERDRRDIVDQAAATVMLSAWLETRRGQEKP